MSFDTNAFCVPPCTVSNSKDRDSCERKTRYYLQEGGTLENNMQREAYPYHCGFQAGSFRSRSTCTKCESGSFRRLGYIWRSPPALVLVFSVAPRLWRQHSSVLTVGPPARAHRYIKVTRFPCFGAQYSRKRVQHHNGETYKYTTYALALCTRRCMYKLVSLDCVSTPSVAASRCCCGRHRTWMLACLRRLQRYRAAPRMPRWDTSSRASQTL